MAVEALPEALARDLPEVPGVRHHLVKVGGVGLHVAEAGAGAPIVLQHGWPEHWYAWRHVIPELARTRRVLAPDLRGLGWSEAPSGGYEKAVFADDLIGVLDAFELDRVDLVGHDWGGFAGFLACLRAPERFGRFLALGIAHPWPQADPLGLVQRLPALSYQFVLAMPMVGEMLLMSSTTPVERGLAESSARPIDPEAIQSYATRLQQRSRASATSALYRTFLTRELPAMVQGNYATGHLTVPTRLLVGSEDPVIKVENLGGYEGHADDMDVVELEGVGHWIPDEAPEEVLAHARSFMGVGGAAGVEAYLHPERQHVEEGLEEVAESHDEGAEADAGAEVHVQEPWPGYDDMTVPQVKERLRDASPEQRAVVRLYESAHKHRTGVLRELGDG
jgi:pimeloyl-ACP methyl ester carboxylesterase